MTGHLAARDLMPGQPRTELAAAAPGPVRSAPAGTAVPTGRWELIRALGSVADTPAAARAASPALGLQPPSGPAHTDVFMLNLPPYASIYLGPDGALGGEGADRAAGFWHAIGISPPAEPDHLSALLSLYSSLGEAAAGASRPATAAALARSRATLFQEHLWPWLPAYLAAVTDLAVPELAAWARLTRTVLDAEYRGLPAAPRLPLALRQAPGLPSAVAGAGDLAAILTTPVRSGIILTRHRLALGACHAAVGHRIGERRFTLRAMLEQDAAATLGWLIAETARWRQRHSAAGPGDQASRWWADRAELAGQFLRRCADALSAASRPPPLAGGGPRRLTKYPRGYNVTTLAIVKGVSLCATPSSAGPAGRPHGPGAASTSIRSCGAFPRRSAAQAIRASPAAACSAVCSARVPRSSQRRHASGFRRGSSLRSTGTRWPRGNRPLGARARSGRVRRGSCGRRVRPAGAGRGRAPAIRSRPRTARTPP